LAVAVALVGTTLASLTAQPGAGAPNAGDVDPGWTSSPLPNGGQKLTALMAAPTSDGAVVVLTTQGVMRLQADGQVDPSYGTTGKVTLPFAPTWISADQTDNDVVVVGQASGSFNAARLLPSGRLDTTFGTGGVVTTGGFGAFPFLDEGRLVIQAAGPPPSIERLTTTGVLDATFGAGQPVALTGHGATGPLALDPVTGTYVLASDRCAVPDVCPFDLVRLGSDGAIQNSVPVESAPSPGGVFRPTAITLGATGEVHVVGDQMEVLVRSDGSLDPTFGQGRCGDPGGTPVTANGTLHLLADGRTVDLASPGTSPPSAYDIVPHAFVRSQGRKDMTFGSGGHVGLPGFAVGAVLLASTAEAMWIGLEDLSETGSTSIIKVLLHAQPGSAPRFGPPATYGDWLIGADGGVISVPPIFGLAPEFCGSIGGTPLAQPVVGGAVSPDGVGYWLVASDGGVFSFGDALFHGSTGAIHLNQPVVGMAPTPDGLGYWLVARDGGVFSFGDAGFFGSTGAMRLNQPIVGMAPTADGHGYWLVASDGGVFCFGDATFLGSTGGLHLNAPVVAMLRTRSGNGYWLLARDGGAFTFGDAGYGNVSAAAPVAGVASGVPDTFTVTSSDGRVRNSDFGTFPQPAVPAQPIVDIISQG
jgi:uncharacterized delta-60 repeat protein